jgi:hypothetical protein
MVDKPVEHNSDLDAFGKIFYPEGTNLTRDRNIQAEQVFQPKDVDKWLSEGMNRSDLQDFDTTNAREPSEREIKSKLRSQMGLGYVESEPERFVHPGHETRKLLEAEKGAISDYNTFKEVVKKAWGNDRSLRDLVKAMNEADYEALFNTRAVQGWVEQNTSDVAISGLMQRFNIERGKATTVYGKMTVENRRKVLSSLIQGTNISLKDTSGSAPHPAPMPIAPPQPIASMSALTQKSRWGTTYTRAKPQKWSDIQIEFVRNNKALPSKAIQGLYNQTFSQHRSLIAIRNKRRRMAE